VRFLTGDDRVKVTIMFRGREQTHPERGVALLMRLAEDVSELGTIEQRPIQDGRNMTMLLSPVPKKQVEENGVDAGPSAAAEPAGEAPAPNGAPAEPAGEASAPKSAPAS
jgi:translation initiation factor IF-3